MSQALDRERAARAQLFAPEAFEPLPPRAARERVLLLWRFPSFSPFASWALYVSSGAHYAVRRLEHDRAEGLPFNVTDPRIFGSEAPVAAALARGVLAQSGALAIPPARLPDSITLDGTAYGIATGTAGAQPLIHTWADHRREWQPLTDWVDETAARFDALLPASTLRGRRA
jgi:hypothetical protein